MPEAIPMFDAIIVGGSYAGLSAALQLARARRRILVIDGGSRRNRLAETSHGFLTQDGRAPDAIVADARAEILAYPSVEWLDAQAEQAENTGRGFSIATADGGRFEARRLVLATGVVDELPDVPGLEERWGKSVFHCPYCHGYELDNGLIGVLAVSSVSMHHALMLPDWGPTTFFLNGAFTPDAEQAEKLRKRRVTVESEPIASISGDRADIKLRDGRVIAVSGLFTVTRTRPSSPLAEQLGCAFEEDPLGRFIQTDASKATSVPGLFACGDAARPAGSVATSVGDGAIAGVAAHQSMVFGDD